MSRKTRWDMFNRRSFTPLRLGIDVPQTHHTQLRSAVRNWAAHQDPPLCAHVYRVDSPCFTPDAIAKWRARGCDAVLAISEPESCHVQRCRDKAYEERIYGHDY